MPNPQQPDLARSRRSDAVSDDAAPAKASRPPRSKAADVPGPVPEANQPGHHPDVEPDKPTEVPRAFQVDPEPEPAPPPSRYAFEFDPLFLPFAAPLGVMPWTTGVSVEDDVLRIRFGLWHLETPVDNIEAAEVTGPYNLLKVVGPPHLSFKDRGLTFATNRRAGVCLRFREPVGRLRHPAVTVTVDAPAALAERVGQ
jgi:hypothetical protein